MEIRLHREKCAPEFTLGSLYIDGDFVGYTCEDADRHMETRGDKVYGRTAIPRGRYEVVLSESKRFAKLMPEVLAVPGFAGVRIHGGNTAADTLGCPLLGEERTATGVRKCAEINAHLIELLRHAESNGERSWLAVE